MRPVLKEAEHDDARPTIIREDSTIPGFLTVFSGKINGIFNLESALNGMTKPTVSNSDQQTSR